MTISDRDDNPYAPPTTAGSADADSGAAPALPPASRLVIAEKSLIVPAGTALPPLCVKTGRPVPDPPIVRRFFWSPQWVYALIGLNPIIGGILFVYFHRRATVAYSLDGGLRRRARIATRINALILLGSIGLMAATPAIDELWPLIAGPGLWVLAAFIYIAAIQTVHAARIEGGSVELWGIPPRIMQAMAAAAKARPDPSLPRNPNARS